MERIRHADADAFGLLLERHWLGLVGYASTIVHSLDTAEDVVQETFIRVWTHRISWQASGSVRAYLHKITRNVALNAQRSAAAEAARRERFARHAATLDPPARPDEELSLDSLRAEIEAAIASLPERRREVFVLSRYSGLSYEEIGETMGVAPQTVANQMAAALSTLRQLLASPHP
jgi:RNA polymerase sigma-70 factor (ECF subfamily)